MSVDKAQREVKGLGITQFIPPGGRFIINNYVVLSSILTSFKNERFRQSDLSEADTILLRAIGNNQNAIDELKKQLNNPLFWLHQGIRWVLNLPIYILEWIGILSKNKSEFR